ncbi:MAG: phosphoribosyltransferase family protein [Nanoarchaeota archaeon]|nr:phosphoribosyltransferase family protein [Nanoarchaeota archaeon]
MKVEVPEWFDSELVSLLEAKIDRSKIKIEERRLDWVMRQIMKALPSSITGVVTKKFTWGDIEHMIEKNCATIDYEPDLVIGIKSGGAFISNYVAKCLEVSEVDYMHVAHYSDNSRSIVKSTLTSALKKAVIKEEPKARIIGKKVLLVDDQTGTGSTLETGKDYLIQKNAMEVKTFCLYTKGPKVDYCKRKGLMLYTPWGKDA